MTPEQLRALQREYPRRKVRAIDLAFLGRDSANGELMIMLATADNLFCYHVPKWEVIPWLLAMRRHLGFLGTIQAVYFFCTDPEPGVLVTIQRITICACLMIVGGLVWLLAIAELVRLLSK